MFGLALALPIGDAPRCCCCCGGRRGWSPHCGWSFASVSSPGAGGVVWGFHVYDTREPLSPAPLLAALVRAPHFVPLRADGRARGKNDEYTVNLLWHAYRAASRRAGLELRETSVFRAKVCLPFRSVNKWRRGESMDVITAVDVLPKPCVDCGLRTGNWCETLRAGGHCFAAMRVPGGSWQPGQRTPLCTGCERARGACHWCHHAPWAEVGEERTHGDGTGAVYR